MSIEVGQQAPDITLTNRDGEPVALSSFRGERNVVLVFYPLAFSGVCTKQLTQMGEQNDTYATHDAQVVAVSVDSRFAQAAFQDQVGADQALFLADFQPRGEGAKAFGVYREDLGFSTRATFVIDKTGVVRSAQVMAVPSEMPDENAYFETLAQCGV
jgi:mycoredoxin-dependent peroxiredoxin